MVLPTTDLAHLYPELWSRLGAAGTQAHTAFKPKATGEFQKHGTWPLPSLRVHITGRSESLSQSTPLQPSRHRQPAGPDTSKLALTSSHALNSQATSWTTFPGAHSARCSSCCSPIPDRRTTSESASAADPYSIHSLTATRVGKTLPQCTQL